MGLIRKIFGTSGTETPRSESRPPSTHFADSEATEGNVRQAQRRDLVKVVLRDTMRKHGIPSDWIDCRTLLVVGSEHNPGMHVQFLVRRADQQLLPYIHAFQESFWEELERTDRFARQWLFSVGWEFYEPSVRGFSDRPDPRAWQDSEQPASTQIEAGDTMPVDDDVESDLAALQALISAPPTPKP